MKIRSLLILAACLPLLAAASRSRPTDWDFTLKGSGQVLGQFHAYASIGGGWSNPRGHGAPGFVATIHSKLTDVPGGPLKLDTRRFRGRITPVRGGYRIRGWGQIGIKVASKNAVHYDVQSDRMSLRFAGWGHATTFPLNGGLARARNSSWIPWAANASFSW